MKKIIALILALTFVFAIAVGCSKDPSKPNDDTTKSQGGDETTAPVEKAWYDELNYDGLDIDIAYQPGEYEPYILGEDGGDIAWAEVYKTNEKVAGKLGVNLNFIPYEGGQETNIKTVYTEIQRGDCPVEICMPDQYYGVCYVTDKVYYNVKDLDIEHNWLNLDADCWYKDYHQNLNPNPNALYFLAGDLSPTILAWCSCSFVNIDLYNNLFGDDEAINEFLDTVEEGHWTIDKCIELCKKAYLDINSDQKVDLGDRLGACTSSGQSGMWASIAAGMTFSRRLGDGSFELELATERNDTIYKKVYELYNKTEGFITYSYSATPYGNQDTFIDGRALLMNEYLLYAFRPAIREMTDSFVIIPRPKADEEVPQYVSSIQDGLKLYSVPVTVSVTDLEAITAYLQLSCEDYNEYVIPRIYETSLKVKYASEKVDPKQVSDLIDLVRSGITADFAVVYNHKLNGIAGLTGSMIENKVPEWNSRVSMQMSQYKTRLKTLLDAFSELG